MTNFEPLFNWNKDLVSKVTQAYHEGGIDMQRSDCPYLTPLEVMVRQVQGNLTRVKGEGSFGDAMFDQVTHRLREVLEKAPDLRIELTAPDGTVVTPDTEYDDEIWGVGTGYDNEWEGTP